MMVTIHRATEPEQTNVSSLVLGCQHFRFFQHKRSKPLFPGVSDLGQNERFGLM
jgi:glutamate racemase